MTISEQTVTGPRGGLPHGGQLVDRRLDAEEASALASSPPSLPLTAAEAADLRALATGAYSRSSTSWGPRSTVGHRVDAPVNGTLVDPGVPGHPRRGPGQTTAAWPCGARAASCWACSRSPRCSRPSTPRPSWCTAPPTPSTPRWPVLGAPAGRRGRPRPGRGRPAGRAGGRAGPDPGETRPRSPSRAGPAWSGSRPNPGPPGTAST